MQKYPLMVVSSTHNARLSKGNLRPMFIRSEPSLGSLS